MRYINRTLGRLQHYGVGNGTKAASQVQLTEPYCNHLNVASLFSNAPQTPEIFLQNVKLEQSSKTS